MPLLSKLLYGSGAVAAGLGAYVASRPKPTPFHVDNVPPFVFEVGGMDIFPLIQFVGRNLPDSTRRKFVTKMGAPRPNETKDRFVAFVEF